ncbi:zinc metallopeptidase [Halalkalibacter hemicellulosilyticus]|uniref:Probable metal-dependent peptidase n=1 Tax=Halalkalibacter hemicellulosilyticusJCM 9152 TaxID=1236971 RepID=W4QCT0_9BACI|nr:zinc metallopeptidase [Halalkalibacter hemicellulosilyticus]GAE29845.1 probable metal-dependent peptidase [Halalkalibacter hemicellulosilyticusJCM 9152]
MIFHPMDFLIFAALGLALWAQTKVKGNFEKWSRVRASSNLTGAQVARLILDKEGLSHVKVEHSRNGTLSDHYDPTAKTVRLSDPVYAGNSISSLAVAAHEVGHAIQDDTRYGMLVLRHRLFPLANIGSQLAPFLFIGGFLLNMMNLVGVGIILFAAAVLFQVVTLPVEFDASNRARKKLIELGLIANREEKGIGNVLNAAALTYVASTLMAILQLIKFILIFRGRR